MFSVCHQITPYSVPIEQLELQIANFSLSVVCVHAQTSLNLQNIYLYVYGIVLNAGGFSLVSGLLSTFYSPPASSSSLAAAGPAAAATAAQLSQKQSENAFFAGYTWLTWTIILTQARPLYSAICISFTLVTLTVNLRHKFTG